MTHGDDKQHSTVADEALWSGSPIRATIARVTTRINDPGLSIELPRDSWWRASDVVSHPEAIRKLLDEVCELYRTDDRQVAASLLVLAYFWYPMVGAIACYLIERRVPDLEPSALAMRLHRGATFLSPRGWALSDDPDAGHPDVAVVQTQDELRAQLVGQLNEQHAKPLFVTLRSVAPYGIPAMRANYVDRLASVILWLAELLGDELIARSEIPAMVALAGPKSRTGFVEIEHAGHARLFLQRGGCCLNYRVRGMQMCATCPLHPPTVREALLRQYVAASTQPT